MITLEECKKYIGNLNLTDEQIEEVRGLLYAFVEKAMDFAVESGTFVLKEENGKKRRPKENTISGPNLLQSVVRTTKK